jgi:hypothetical protein
MPRLTKIPAYRLHKRSGLVVVTPPDGFGCRRDVQFRKYDTPESRAEYDRVTAERMAKGRRLEPLPERTGTDNGLSAAVELRTVLDSWLD